MRFLVDCIFLVHIILILLAIFGALWTNGRPFWTFLHILGMIWGIVVEVTPVPCPVTLAENWAMHLAGERGYHGGFIQHYSSALIYPNLPYWLVTTIGVSICVFNLGIYGLRFVRWFRGRQLRLAGM